ncbi:hypothetical protein MA16_Dca021293 [Dendrobium catenatum]|uniref:Uncharacterized protein n=1 Tax=Dendrobium catenatum TaxID=906689 RepID=A0A2I0XHF6_9ASPA|nr:hypothetical protein MA16_Dca021293 [Dendrobium catenatum]
MFDFCCLAFSIPPVLGCSVLAVGFPGFPYSGCSVLAPWLLGSPLLWLLDSCCYPLAFPIPDCSESLQCLLETNLNFKFEIPKREAGGLAVPRRPTEPPVARLAWSGRRWTYGGWWRGFKRKRVWLGSEEINWVYEKENPELHTSSNTSNRTHKEIYKRHFLKNSQRDLWNLGTHKEIFGISELTKKSFHFLKNSQRDFGNLGTHKEILLLS